MPVDEHNLAVLTPRVLDLGPPKQRAVLGALLIEANRVVSLDRLIDELWGDDPPPRPPPHCIISHLRRLPDSLDRAKVDADLKEIGCDSPQATRTDR